MDNWLLLTDYSSKYRVSVSTLRRRIKGDQIAFKFESGKYFILDTPPTETATVHPKTGLRPGGGTMVSPTSVRQPAQAATEAAPLKQAPAPLPQASASTPQPQSVSFTEETVQSFEAQAAKDEPIIATATKLLNELKRAYMNILQEKEEQIIQLKEEVSDLKTLVRVLEDDNERLRRLTSQKNPAY